MNSCQDYTADAFEALPHSLDNYKRARISILIASVAAEDLCSLRVSCSYIRPSVTDETLGS